MTKLTRNYHESRARVAALKDLYEKNFIKDGKVDFFKTLSGEDIYNAMLEEEKNMHKFEAAYKAQNRAANQKAGGAQ